MIYKYVLYKHKLYRNITGTNSTLSPDLDTINWQEASIASLITNNYNTFLSVSGAAAYEPGQSYTDGDYVVYNNVIYKNVSNNPDGNAASSIPNVGSGDGTKNVWIPVTLTEMIDRNYSTFISTIGASDYNPSHSYQAGDYVIYNNHLYQNISGSNGTPGSSDAWRIVSVTNSLDTLRTDLDALAIKSESDLEDTKNALSQVISENKNLTDEEMRTMLQKINDNDDATKESMNTLADNLTEIINDNASLSAAERAALLAQINALRDSTATDLSNLKASTTKDLSNLRESTTKDLSNLRESTTKDLSNLKESTAKDLSNLKSSTATDLSNLKSYVDQKDNEIKARLTDNGKEFKFGYKNGTYGYYVDKTFYPF